MIVFEIIGTVLSYIIGIPLFIYIAYVFLSIWGSGIDAILNPGDND